MTSFYTYQNRLQSLLHLCRIQGTGPTRSLANKYGISERTVKRMIDMLRSEGYPIIYSRTIRSYVVISEAAHPLKPD